MNREPLVLRVDRLDLRFAQKPWAFAIGRRADIDAYFAELQREKPAVWNGRVLLRARRLASRCSRWRRTPAGDRTSC